MKANPTKVGKYVARMQWTVHGKLFDDWVIKEWDANAGMCSVVPRLLIGGSCDA